NEAWFSDVEISRQLYKLLEETGTTNVLVDTAGRRDMVHMRLTTPVAFIRYVGANHPSDYDRLIAWVQVIKKWKEAGLQQLNFFIHQNIEQESPLLAAHFIAHLNKEIGTDLRIPNKENTVYYSSYSSSANIRRSSAAPVVSPTRSFISAREAYKSE